MNSFFPDSIKIWNSIGIDFAQVNSYSSFKEKINVLIRPIAKPIFGIHGPVGLKFLYQLRVGLSPLRYHKYRHNFQDTPNSLCSCLLASEDTAHFLLSCPLYTTPRMVLLNSISHILDTNNLSHLSETIDVFLYGHRLLSFSDNKKVLKSTITYIKESNRFT